MEHVGRKLCAYGGYGGTDPSSSPLTESCEDHALPLSPSQVGVPLFTGVVGDLAGFFFDDTLRMQDEVRMRGAARARRRRRW